MTNEKLTELLKIAYRWGRDNGSNRSEKNFNDLLQTEAIYEALRIHDDNFMKAILDVPEKEISFEFDNLTINQFRMIGSKPNDKIPMILEKFPVGVPITLITSNMPEVLKEEIIKLISQYCGH